MIKRLFFLATLTLSAGVASAQVPNYSREVETCVARYPAAWNCANEQRECKVDFIVLCARDLHKLDPRVGLNGKRGDPNNISADVLDFAGLGTTRDVLRGGALAIVDVIASSDSPDRRVSWHQHDIGPGTWVNPFSVEPSSGGEPTPAPTPPAADPIGRALAQIDEMHEWTREIREILLLFRRTFFPQ